MKCVVLFLLFVSLQQQVYCQSSSNSKFDNDDIGPRAHKWSFEFPQRRTDGGKNQQKYVYM